MDEDSSTEQKTFDTRERVNISSAKSLNFCKIGIASGVVVVVVVVVCFLFCFCCCFLLSHHLCRPQRHCSRAARPGIPHLWPHPGLIPHRGPAPRGPQEETSDRW